MVIKLLVDTAFIVTVSSYINLYALHSAARTRCRVARNLLLLIFTIGLVHVTSPPLGGHGMRLDTGNVASIILARMHAQSLTQLHVRMRNLSYGTDNHY